MKTNKFYNGPLTDLEPWEYQEAVIDAWYESHKEEIENAFVEAVTEEFEPWEEEDEDEEEYDEEKAREEAEDAYWDEQYEKLSDPCYWE